MVMQADELKTLRTVAGYSQADLGEAIGMSRESIGAMERGQAGIELRTELAVRYVVEQRARHSQNVSDLIAAGVAGQGELAIRNLQDVKAAILKDEPFLRTLAIKLRDLG